MVDLQLVAKQAIDIIYIHEDGDPMANKRGAKTKTAKGQETIPILIRLCRADHELVKKRASMLGMNLSTFLRLLIRTGRIELDERKQKI
jgi:hypothetical protein